MIIPFVRYGIRYWRGLCISTRASIPCEESFRETGNYGVCGFDPHRGSGAVPPSWVYTRFLKLLLRFKAEIDGMFDHLVDELKRLLPDLGFSVAVDSKG